MQIKIRPPFTPKKIAFVAGSHLEEAKKVSPNEYAVQLFIKRCYNLPSIRSFSGKHNLYLSHITYYLQRYPKLQRIKFKVGQMEMVLLPEDTQDYLCGIIRKRGSYARSNSQDRRQEDSNKDAFYTKDKKVSS